MDEHAAVIAEVATIASAEEVDLVVVSGDLFDRPLPPVEAMRVAFRGLVALTDGGRVPVVVVAGNHDSGDLFETLAPLFAGSGVYLVGRIKPPDADGVLDLETPGGRALVACFPFLREGLVVDFMSDVGHWYGDYAGRIRRLCDAYNDYLTAAAPPDAATLLVAHFLVTGARVGGHGAPRGERELHMGVAYTAAEDAVPPSVGYVAMGHVHAPQPVPHANVPAEYAGSLLQLDFGEAGEQKRVVVVDIEPPAPAVVRSIPLTAGRPLCQAAGTWADLVARDDLVEAYLDLVVHTDGPDPGLGDRAREEFPWLVKVRAEYESAEAERPSRGGRPLDELYGDYHLAAHDEPAADALLAAFRDVWEEAAGATT